MTASHQRPRAYHAARRSELCHRERTLCRRLRPYHRDGQRTGALRFGDGRVMALAGALCLTVQAIAGFNNRSLRALVGELLGSTYTSAQMTYDLRRLRLHGLIARVPKSNTYFLTPQGLRVALFYTKVHDRLLTPLLGADTPPANELMQSRDVLRELSARPCDGARARPSEGAVSLVQIVEGDAYLAVCHPLMQEPGKPGSRRVRVRFWHFKCSVENDRHAADGTLAPVRRPPNGSTLGIAMLIIHVVMP